MNAKEKTYKQGVEKYLDDLIKDKKIKKLSTNEAMDLFLYKFKETRMDTDMWILFCEKFKELTRDYSNKNVAFEETNHSTKQAMESFASD